LDARWLDGAEHTDVRRALGARRRRRPVPEFLQRPGRIRRSHRRDMRRELTVSNRSFHCAGSSVDGRRRFRGRRADSKLPLPVESFMRLVPFAALAAVAAAVAVSCSSSDRSPLSETQQAAHVPDLVGTPDLTVDRKVLATSWVVYDQVLKENFCSLEEG